MRRMASSAMAEPWARWMSTNLRLTWAMQATSRMSPESIEVFKPGIAIRYASSPDTLRDDPWDAALCDLARTDTSWRVNAAAPWPLVAPIGPKACCCCLAGPWGQHLDWCVVGKDGLPGQHMPADGIRPAGPVTPWIYQPSRPGSERSMSIPSRSRDTALAIERQMVGVFVDQNIRQQAGPGRPRSIGRDGNGACVKPSQPRARHAWPHDAVHDEPPRHILQLFGHVLAQTAQGATALGAIVVARRQFDFHAWDVIRDWSALWFILGLFVGETQLCCHLRNCDLACLQRQLKLFDAL